MKIYLLNDHTAYLIDDKAERVTVVNGETEAGVLHVEGERFPVRNGEEGLPRLPELIGHVRAHYTDARGIRWRILHPRMVHGVPYSAVDGSTLELRLLIDGQAREIERLTRELLDLRGQIEPDALGHMNIGGEENE
jgi:hypothetical protein